MADVLPAQTPAPAEVLGHRIQQSLQVILAGLDERDAPTGPDMEALRRELRMLLLHPPDPVSAPGATRTFRDVRIPAAIRCKADLE